MQIEGFSITIQMLQLTLQHHSSLRAPPLIQSCSHEKQQPTRPASHPQPFPDETLETSGPTENNRQYRKYE